MKRSLLVYYPPNQFVLFWESLLTLTWGEMGKKRKERVKRRCLNKILMHQLSVRGRFRNLGEKRFIFFFFFSSFLLFFFFSSSFLLFFFFFSSFLLFFFSFFLPHSPHSPFSLDLLPEPRHPPLWLWRCP